MVLSLVEMYRTMKHGAQVSTLVVRENRLSILLCDILIQMYTF